MDTNLDGRVVIVTGAGAGLGRAAAKRFALEGAAVSCADVDRDAAQATADELIDSGGRALAVTADVCDQAATEALAEVTLKEFGSIDVLYANAGIAGAGTAQSTTLDSWQRVLDVNVTGTWLSARAVIPTMRSQRRGVILLQSSIAALVGIPDGAAYAASKGAVLALARQMNADLVGLGIRVNAICPGTVATALVRGMAAGKAEANAITPDEALERLAARYPIGRLAEAEEIADAAVFVASDRGSFMAGAGVVVDGGMTSI